MRILAVITEPEEDLAHLSRLGDHPKNPHRGRAAGTDQRVDLVHLSNQSHPGRAAFLAGDRVNRFSFVGLHVLVRLLLLLFPPRGGQPHHMRLVRPFSLDAGGIHAVAPNALAALRWNVLGELQEKPHYRKGLGLPLEELALGGEGDRSGLAILLDADLL